MRIALAGRVEGGGEARARAAHSMRSWYKFCTLLLSASHGPHHLLYASMTQRVGPASSTVSFHVSLSVACEANLSAIPAAPRPPVAVESRSAWARAVSYQKPELLCMHAKR